MQSVREEPLLEPEFQTKPCRSDTSTPCMIFWESLYTTFPQMKKADVNGENELPLYTWLKAQKGSEGFQEHEYGTYPMANRDYHTMYVGEIVDAYIIR